MTKSQFSEASDSPGFLLWHTTLRWQRTMRAALDQHDLTHVQFVLLASCWWLTEHGGPPTQRELAEHSACDVMMTSQVVRTLASAGLVDRHRDDSDGRVWRIRLTRAGATRLQAALPDVERADAEFFAPAATMPVVKTLQTLLAPPKAQ